MIFILHHHYMHKWSNCGDWYSKIWTPFMKAALSSCFNVILDQFRPEKDKIMRCVYITQTTLSTGLRFIRSSNKEIESSEACQNPMIETWGCNHTLRIEVKCMPWTEWNRFPMFGHHWWSDDFRLTTVVLVQFSLFAPTVRICGQMSPMWKPSPNIKVTIKNRGQLDICYIKVTVDSRCTSKF